MPVTKARRARTAQATKPVAGAPVSNVPQSTEPRVALTERQIGRLEESHRHLQQAQAELNACPQAAVFSAAQRSFNSAAARTAQEAGCMTGYQLNTQSWEFVKIDAPPDTTPEALTEDATDDPDTAKV